MSIKLRVTRKHEDASALTGTPAEFSNGNGHCSIFVVDDEPNVRNLMRELLGAEGYQVTEASNGSEAAASLFASPPHLIVAFVRCNAGFSIADLTFNFTITYRSPALTGNHYSEYQLFLYQTISEHREGGMTFDAIAEWLKTRRDT